MALSTQNTPKRKLLHTLLPVIWNVAVPVYSVQDCVMLSESKMQHNAWYNKRVIQMTEGAPAYIVAMEEDGTAMSPLAWRGNLHMHFRGNQTWQSAPVNRTQEAEGKGT